MTSLLSLLEGIWVHVGPGLLLVLALPVTLVALVAVVREGLERRPDRS